jgi:hypothetical protein
LSKTAAGSRRSLVAALKEGIPHHQQVGFFTSHGGSFSLFRDGGSYAPGLFYRTKQIRAAAMDHKEH